MRRPWTTHEIARLKELHGKVHPGVIARELGRTLQMREAGASNLGEMRGMVLRVRAFDRGWGAVSTGEADILDQLEGGPKTRRMIVGALGKPWRGCKSLVDAEGRSHMRALVARGLVVRCGCGMALLPNKEPRDLVYALAPGVKRRKQQRGVAA